MNYYILLSTIALFGCVGSVEEARKDLTESVEETKQSDLSFDGIHSLIPIANDKIEVYFFPASGGSKEYTYLIYVGNQPQPVSINEENMRKDYRGLFVYTLHGLSVGTNYVVKVDVKDRENEDVFVTESSMSTFTFRNEVADFFGVSSLSNLGGYEGVDSISVRWPHATIFPGNILGSDRDPIAYEITLLDSSRLTPAAFNDFSLGFSDGKITKTVNYDPLVNTNIVRSLEEDKLYYVNVRAIHRGTVNDPNNPRLRSDLNNKYFEIKTLSQNSSEIEYTLDDYFLTGTSGSSMMTSLSMNWEAW